MLEGGHGSGCARENGWGEGACSLRTGCDQVGSWKVGMALDGHGPERMVGGRGHVV